MPYWSYPQGFIVDPANMDQAGATAGQALVWDGSQWGPEAVLTLSPSGPGEDSLTYDSITDTGYYGEVATSELVEGDALALDVGLGAGISYNSDTPWLKFFVGASADCNADGVDKVVYIAKKPYRYDLSWNDIYNEGCVYGVDGPGPYDSGSDTNQLTIVTYSGYDFKVRLLTGSENNPAPLDAGNTYCGDDVGNASEWNDLMYRVHECIPNCASPLDCMGGYTEYHGGPQGGSNWVNYTNCDLLVESGCGDGSYTWCQETGNDTSRRVYRGYYGFAFFHTYPADHAYTGCGWRPVLELVQP